MIYAKIQNIPNKNVVIQDENLRNKKSHQLELYNPI